ncbi:lipase [Gordonia desulfuricans]|uniref:Lipase n=1 Tax=Gordonia desulfuricans TaxID=89051 RepID=A0A7K3LWM5_9ACTN|nr:lipase family protein [Gordonia desulfuricans]NDK91957.1 lipase [Gordonia desulfuricans]
MSAALAVLLAVALTTAAGVAAADGVPGAGTSDPRVVASHPVHNRVVALPAASSTTFIRYTSISVRGTPTQMTGTLLLPRGVPPAGGWPLAVWNHETTGGADACAPSGARSGDPDVAAMTTGDEIVSGLLARGFAVVRPDFEGLGGPGPHPYLIGHSLARSAIDAAVAVARADPRIGRDVVVAGHSEGAVAALFAAGAPESQWRGLHLRGVSAVAPPSGIVDAFEPFAEIPVAGPAVSELTGLAALVISGGMAAGPDFAALMVDGGLSPRARHLLAQIETRCYSGLIRPDSFGGLAPSGFLGSRGEQARRAIIDLVDRNDVAGLRIRPDLPIRLDAGTFDTVAPAPTVAALADRYRAQGSAVTVATHATTHALLPSQPSAATGIVRWLVGVAG